MNVKMSCWGTAGYKYDDRQGELIANQMHIKAVSGTFSGDAWTSEKSSVDFSNYHGYRHGPVSGTVNMKFNKKMTELIKGTADWEVIAARVLAKMKHSQVVDDSDGEEADWKKWGEGEWRE